MFETDAELARADWPLLQNGPINLFWRSRLLQAAKADLSTLGYTLIEASCHSPDRFQRELGGGLHWFEQFGYEPWDGNLNALADAFVVFPPLLGEQAAICLDGFHNLAAEDLPFAAGVLDVLAEGCRRQLVHGRRLVVLVQTDDSQFVCEGLGATRANWNTAEWLNKNRGVH